MPNPNEFTVEGEIKSIRFPRGNRGRTFGVARVKGKNCDIEVVMFDGPKMARLRAAKVGDQMRATGTGYHKGGSFRALGNTNLTARTVSITPNEMHRTVIAAQAAMQPKQLSLF